jgi:hypothetical protein
VCHYFPQVGNTFPSIHPTLWLANLLNKNADNSQQQQPVIPATDCGTAPPIFTDYEVTMLWTVMTNMSAHLAWLENITTLLEQAPAGWMNENRQNATFIYYKHLADIITYTYNQPVYNESYFANGFPSLLNNSS